MLDAPVVHDGQRQGQRSPRSHPLLAGVVGTNGGIAGDARGDRAGRPGGLRRLPRRARPPPSTGSIPAPATVKILHIDVDPDDHRRRTTGPTCALVGDAKLGLRRCTPRCSSASRIARRTRSTAGPTWRKARRAKQAFSRRSADVRRTRRSSPSAWSLRCNRLLPQGRHRGRRPRHALPLFLGLLRARRRPGATSSPTARTARSASRCPPASARIFGRPDATVVSVMGDGSFGFTCGEMETIVRPQACR